MNEPAVGVCASLPVRQLHLNVLVVVVVETCGLGTSPRSCSTFTQPTQHTPPNGWCTPHTHALAHPHTTLTHTHNPHTR